MIIRNLLLPPSLEELIAPPWVYNLYLGPKEQASTGHRYIEWGMGTITGLAKQHASTFIDFPMKDIGLGFSGK